MNTDELRQHAQHLVAGWPPLTRDQTDRLRSIFRTAVRPDATPARRKAA